MVKQQVKSFQEPTSKQRKLKSQIAKPEQSDKGPPAYVFKLLNYNANLPQQLIFNYLSLENILRIRRLNVALNRLYLSGAVPRNLQIPALMSSNSKVQVQRIQQILGREETLVGPLSLDFSKLYFQNSARLNPHIKGYIHENYSVVKYDAQQFNLLGVLLQKLKGLEEFRAPAGDVSFYHEVNRDQLKTFYFNRTIMLLSGAYQAFRFAFLDESVRQLTIIYSEKSTEQENLLEHVDASLEERKAVGRLEDLIVSVNGNSVQKARVQKIKLDFSIIMIEGKKLKSLALKNCVLRSTDSFMPHFSSQTFSITNLRELTLENFLAIGQINKLLAVNTKLLLLDIKVQEVTQALNLAKLNELQCFFFECPSQKDQFNQLELHFEISEKQIASLKKVRVNFWSVSQQTLKALLRLYAAGNLTEFNLPAEVSFLQLEKDPIKPTFSNVKSNLTVLKLDDFTYKYFYLISEHFVSLLELQVTIDSSCNYRGEAVNSALVSPTLQKLVFLAKTTSEWEQPNLKIENCPKLKQIKFTTRGRPKLTIQDCPLLIEVVIAAHGLLLLCMQSVEALKDLILDFDFDNCSLFSFDNGQNSVFKIDSVLRNLERFYIRIGSNYSANLSSDYQVLKYQKGLPTVVECLTPIDQHRLKYYTVGTFPFMQMYLLKPPILQVLLTKAEAQIQASVPLQFQSNLTQLKQTGYSVPSGFRSTQLQTKVKNNLQE